MKTQAQVTTDQRKGEFITTVIKIDARIVTKIVSKMTKTEYPINQLNIRGNTILKNTLKNTRIKKNNCLKLKTQLSTAEKIMYEFFTGIFVDRIPNLFFT